MKRTHTETTRLAAALAFVRSALAGTVATLADLAVIAVAVGALGISPRIANVPALLVGAAVQFVGNRHFAFNASRGSLGRQMLWFTLSEAVALVLNALLYDAVARSVTLDALDAVLLRMGTCFVVFVGWSYPVWRRVFRSDSVAASEGSAAS